MANQLQKYSYPLTYQWNFDHEIESASNSTELKDIVALNIKKYYRVNITSTMRNLIQVSTLLKYALAGSRNEPCAGSVGKVQTEYLQLLREALSKTHGFGLECLDALTRIKEALDPNKSAQEIFKIISEVSGFAGRIGNACNELTNKSTALETKAFEAYEKALNDESTTSANKKALLKKKSELQGEEARLKQTVQDLIKEIEKLTKEENDIALEAKTTRDRVFFVSVITSIAEPATKMVQSYFNPVGSTLQSLSSNPQDQHVQKLNTNYQNASSELKKLNIQKAEVEQELKGHKEDSEEAKKLKIRLAGIQASIEQETASAKEWQVALANIQNDIKKMASSIEEKENRIAELRMKLQEQHRNANGELAKSVILLSNLVKEGDGLEISLMALDVTVRTLGKISSIFVVATLFWQNFQQNCQSMSRLVGRMEGSDTKMEEFRDNLNDLGLKCLTLAKVNLMAQTGLEKAFIEMRKVLDTGTSAEKSAELVKEISPKLATQLQQEEEI